MPHVKHRHLFPSDVRAALEAADKSEILLGDAQGVGHLSKASR